MDVVDRLPCIDVVCEHGGHRGCDPLAAFPDVPLIDVRDCNVRPSLEPVFGSPAWWADTVARMQRRTREEAERVA